MEHLTRKANKVTTSYQYTFSTELELNNDLIELSIDFTYFPPTRGERERSSGVQLSPDDPAEIEIDKILDSEDNDVTDVILSDYQELLEERAWQYLENLKYSDY